MLWVNTHVDSSPGVTHETVQSPGSSSHGNFSTLHKYAFGRRECI